MAEYDERFFAYVDAGAVRSAHRIIPLLLESIEVRSVLDVGCARGAWLSVWSELGVHSVFGIDGHYVDTSQLRIARECFSPYDLRREFDLERRFDLVQCLEVAEHLPATSALALVETLVRHGDFVLFSAAPKGQGGTGHINEQSYEYWRAIFARKGYVPFDCLRPRIMNDRRIEAWYRYNALLYVSRSAISSLPAILRASRLPDDEPIPDLSPFGYRVWKAIVRGLPGSFVT
jgi:SAM-dependent methyltransferase